MKIKNIYGAVGVMLLAGAVASCSDNYLEQPPITYIADSTIGESIEAARAALYGACQGMNIGQYLTSGGSDRNNMGEGWIRTCYGDFGGPDYWDSFLWGYQSEFQWNSLILQNNNYWSKNGWMYGYNLANQVNVILQVIDDVPAEQADKDFIKAQCLTIRAHAYIRLMQVYAPRFEDRKDGSVFCIILRDKPGTEAMALSTYDECIKFIYKDLDDAIALYESCEKDRSFGFEPNIDVARCLYSRIALLNHDWEKSSQMAAAARVSYPIMSSDEYLQGFADPNGEWIWYNDPDETYVGYVSWGASFSCNGAYAVAYNFSGAGCISFRLYDEIYNRNPEDVRCALFWTPDKANKYVDFKINREDFWNPKMVNSEYGFMYGSGMDEKMTASISLFARHMCPNTEFGESAFGVDTSLTDENAGKAIARRSWFNSASVKNGVNVCQPGAQVKFWSYSGKMGASSIPFFRSAEMLLNQAEAEYELGHEANAKALLEELNKKRMPSYSCDLTGEALRDEIRLYRRMELWGEGDTWFSYKRWNIGFSREKWVANDPSSDTFLSAYEGTFEPTLGRGWRYRIPTSETNYNDLVNDQLNLENK